MTQEFGNGIDLTQDGDLKVDNSGDIAAAFGSDELEKDLAYQVWRELIGTVGSLATRPVEAKTLALDATDRILEDPRIVEVEEVDVFVDRNTEEETIKMEVFAESSQGEISTVIPVIK